ncbi:O-antigen ligase family protein [Halomonas getboli]|uniref:O-antigen ligase family protein n=1 Tax=Halomonas getboli TaxID=2935862 RepID=UPI001FFE621A|nr:O-antigen ligase family protein [Halomonas getboli]MCK2182999.1 hypothetical protein [Halomonas getboli]
MAIFFFLAEGRGAMLGIKDQFICTVLFFSVLAATFVSDFVVLESIPAFYLCWFFIIALRFIFKIQYKKSEFYSQASLVCLLSPLFFNEAFSGAFYANAFAFTVLYVNVIYVLPCFFKRPGFFYFLCLFVLFLLSIFSLYSILFENGRAHILFGPNVLYRIYVFIFALSTLSIFLNKGDSGVALSGQFWLLFVLFSLCITATGSRGALLSAFLSLLYLVINKKEFFGKRFAFLKSFVFYMLVSSLLAYVFYSYYDVIWRLIYFNLDNNSEAARVSFYKTSIDYFFSGQGLSLFLGRGSLEYIANFGYYPHSFFVEALAYGGLLFSFLALFSYLSYGLFCLKSIMRCWVVFPYLGIFFGALVSGDLLYNYPVFSLSASLLFSCFVVKDGYFSFDRGGCV